MKTKIIVLSTCILLVLSMVIIESTYPKVDAKTINTIKVVLPTTSLIKISKLTFKFEENNKIEVIGTITNNNKLGCPVKLNVSFSNINGSKIFYNLTITNNYVNPGETIKFNIPIYKKNMQNKIYRIKVIDNDSTL